MTAQENLHGESLPDSCTFPAAFAVLETAQEALHVNRSKLACGCAQCPCMPVPLNQARHESFSGSLAMMPDCCTLIFDQDTQLGRTQARWRGTDTYHKRMPEVEAFGSLQIGRQKWSKEC